MKLIMESFQSATAKLVREGSRPEGWPEERSGLTKTDLFEFLDEVPYSDPLPPFVQAGITPEHAGDASRAMFIQHLQDQAQKGIPVMTLAELSDMYFDYWDFLDRMMDPEDTSHLPGSPTFIESKQKERSKDIINEFRSAKRPGSSPDEPLGGEPPHPPGAEFVPRLFQQLYDTFPGLENLLAHSARTSESEGKALSPIAKMILGAKPRVLERD